MSIHVWLLTFLLILPFSVRAQTPYILNGSAIQNTCNCYTLTEDLTTQSGTVWNKNKINLHNSFDYYFDVNLGCKDDNGADGIGFIMQTRGTNLGATGQGLGFKGITPSLGILIDTWMNSDDHDPAYDHVSIQMNGVIDHDSPNNLAGPVTVLDGVDNIEDCNWHIFRINWDADSLQMTVSVDGKLRLSLKKDLVNDIFLGDPSVYWGFAGSTGGFSNKQQFCAALRPELAFSNDQKFCIGTPLIFSDSSRSFGTITRWQWNFGDGAASTASQPPPHLYATPGTYDVTMVIEDNSGCVSDTMHQQVTIGTYPVAKFTAGPLCLTRPLLLKDASTVQTGTLTKWDWELNGHPDSGPGIVADYTSAGTYPVHLTVTTKERCSDDTIQQVSVFNTPVINASGGDACIGDAISFTGTDLTPAIPLAAWHWDLGNGTLAGSRQLNYIYPDSGLYHVSLYVVSNDGCFSDTANLTVKVTDLSLNAGNDTIIAKGQPLQLNAAAAGDNLSYNWIPATGLNSAAIAAPLATLQHDQQYVVIVQDEQGCVQRDTISIKAYTGPEFYVPSAFSPNHDGQNDLFRAIAAGVPKLDFLCVWDRWGHEVFRTSSLSEAWDGTFKGQEAPAGTYVYQIQGTDYLGHKFSRKGTVTIIR